MISLALATAFLVAMCLEVAREAYGDRWEAKHFRRMTPFTRFSRPPQDWWAERKTIRERLEHRRRWHIDLLGRTKIKELKK